MSRRDDDRTALGFEGIEQRLRDSDPEFSALDLDRIKLQAKARAFASRPKGNPVRSRLVAGLVTIGLLAGGTGGVLAKSGDNGGKGDSGGTKGGSGEKSAGEKQYCHHGSHASQCQQRSQTTQSHQTNQPPQHHSHASHQAHYAKSRR